MSGYSRLEETRLLVEACETMTGQLYDYLDRGRPSPEQESRTWQALRRLEEERVAQCEAFDRLFEEVSRESPGAIADWAGRHAGICRLVAEGAEAGSSQYPDTDLEAMIARRLEGEWNRVSCGERLCIVEHPLMRRYHRELYSERLGPFEVPSGFLPRPPWEK